MSSEETCWRARRQELDSEEIRQDLAIHLPERKVLRSSGEIPALASREVLEDPIPDGTRESQKKKKIWRIHAREGFEELRIPSQTAPVNLQEDLIHRQRRLIEG
jgi:hypothetical protein